MTTPPDPEPIKVTATLSAVVQRADGTVEDLGVIAERPATDEEIETFKEATGA